MSDKQIPNNLNNIPNWLTDEFQENFLPGEKKDIIAKDNGSKVLSSKQVKQLAKKIESGLKGKRGLNADLRHAKSSREVAEKKLHDAKALHAEKIEEIYLLLRKIIETISKSTINPSLLEYIYQEVYKNKLLRRELIDERWKLWEPILPSIATECGTIIHSGTSLISHKGTNIGFTRNNLTFKDLIIGWNNQHKSFDSTRIFVGNGLTSVALCDGTSEGGFSSQIISRIFSSLISERFALSNRALSVLFSNNMLMDFVDRQCFSKSEDVAYLSRLTRQLPIESVRKVKSGGYIHGKTTVVNFIILDNGLCWYRYVGDSYLFLIRDGIIKQLTTNRLSQSNSSIEAIGLSSNVSPKEAKNIFLQENDILIGCSDLLGDNIMKDEKIGLSLADLVHDNPGDLNKQTDQIESLFSKTDEGDDISFVTYYYKGRGLNLKKIQFEDRSQLHHFELFLGGERFDQCIDNKYFFQSTKDNPKGFKSINKETAAILSQFKKSHEIDFPKFIPNFDIFTDSNNQYYIVMDHLQSSKYERLDHLIKSLKTREEVFSVIEIIKNLELEFEKRAISHSDISPSNIFVDRKSNIAIVIDLNTLCWSLSIPKEGEAGHKGMYGADPYKSNIASIYSHRLPFRIIELSLYLLSTIFDKGKFVGDLIEWSSDDTIILTPDEIFECIKGKNKQAINEIINRLKNLFPDSDEFKIREYIDILHIKSLYDLN